MDLKHEFTVEAPVETVWSTMMDLESVAECFPGATLTNADGDSFEGTVKVKLGPIAMVYKGSGSFVEKDESGRRAVIEAKGRDKRGNGTAGAEVVMVMTSEGSGTRVDVTTDLNVTGKPAQFGRGVMQDVSDKLLGQFTDCLARRFEEPTGAESETTAAPATAETAASGSAAGGSSATPAAGEGSEAAGAAAPAAAVATPAAPGPESPARPEAPGAGSPARSSAASSGSADSGSDDAIDLGGMLVPGMVRGYLPHAGAALLGLVIGWRLGWKMGRWVGRRARKS